MTDYEKALFKLRCMEASTKATENAIKADYKYARTAIQVLRDADEIYKWVIEEEKVGI